MNERTLRDDLLHLGYVSLWWILALATTIGLGQLGLHGEWVFAVCYAVSATTGVAVSKGRREVVLSLVRAARVRVLRLHQPRSERRSRIELAPASRLDRIARLFWSSTTYDRVFKPARADILREWEQAELAGDHRRVRMIRYVSGPISVLQHMAAQVPVSIVKLLVKVWRA